MDIFRQIFGGLLQKIHGEKMPIMQYFLKKLLINPIRATCPINGIVLDPFSGTGSTVYTALKLNRRGLGIDLCEQYNDIARQRMKEICGNLF
jgi:tRNA G10  N-methylase Trm11